jgi:hypothetical protein
VWACGCGERGGVGVEGVGAWEYREWERGVCALGVWSLAYKRASVRGKGAKDAEGHAWRLERHQGASENELQPTHTVLVIEFNRNCHQMDPDYGTPHAVQIHYPS